MDERRSDDMSLIEWSPYRDLERDAGGFFDRFPFRFPAGANTPRVDVYQTENDVIVKAEVPGVSKEDLDVYIDDSTVRLSGQTRKNEEYKEEHVYRTERYYGSFSRTIPLPVEVKSEQAHAEYRDGILSITVPKIEPSRARSKKIDIQ
jgi:HSP20 family protein